MGDLGAATGYLVVFAIIGFFELFDRTSFALIAIAARAPPFPTWAGGAAAFLASTAIAVTVGAAFSDVLGPTGIGWLRVAGGSFLLAYAGWLATRPDEEETNVPAHRARSPFVLALVTILLLELGDTTMIFQIVLVTDWGWFVVLVAGAAALVTVAAWDVVLGRRLGLRIRPKTLKRLVIVVLTVVGVVTIAYGLAPSAFPTLGFAATTGALGGG
jgi:putative Ca2+/H+ antiporter (TMEM165/GDT1 family)